ncbi:MAG: protein translocase subunit [Watsoniomyces obsoletus]|nr:MAG: protein translocase subunit [Watsoniomyces obsoletus]
MDPSWPGQPSRRSVQRPAPPPTQSTEILINVYDLIPPGRLSSVLWTLGTSPLHSGVVIREREYAYGGHGHAGISGVYWTPPRVEPPGGTFRAEIAHGYTTATDEELDAMIKEIAEQFLGPTYNLLHRNCNHFTDALCRRLTSRPAPGFLNRAASIALLFPCFVPQAWATPPDYETAEGELVDEDEANERSLMLHHGRLSREHDASSIMSTRASESLESDAGSGISKGVAREENEGQSVIDRDSSGRLLPPSERAPAPRTR